jgi:hypothetical protein
MAVGGREYCDFGCRVFDRLLAGVYFGSGPQ